MNPEYPRQCGYQASGLAPEEMVVDVHLQFRDGANLDGAAVLEDRAAFG
jgi:hypothetical protein